MSLPTNDDTIRTLSKDIEDKDAAGRVGYERKYIKYSYDEAVELAGNGWYNYGLLVVCSLISIAMALDMFGFALVIATSACDLDLTMKQKGILASIPFTGMLFSYPWGYFADTRGRKVALMWSTCVGFMFSALTSLSWNWYAMLVCKFIGSSFSSITFTLTITLLGECTDQRHRGQYLLVMNSINMGSEAVSFLLAYLVLPLTFSYPIPWLSISYRPWRLLTFLMAVPLALGAAMLVFFHESPKFLANKGDTAKALEVLRDIFKRNGGDIDKYPVKELKTESDKGQTSKVSFVRSLWMQTAPIFKPPLLLRTLQLYYLTIIICSTNNVFVMWFPTIVNSFYISYSDTTVEYDSFCDRITESELNITEVPEISAPCNDVLSQETIWAGVSYGVFFCVLTLLVSKAAAWRRVVLIVIFLVCAFSCAMLNLVNHPIVSMVFFVLLQGTSVGLGIAVSYFVDLYPTSYRGMVSSLGLMLGRMSSFAGVNLIGAVINNHCQLTFYMWTVFILSGVVLTFLLPPDGERKKTLQKELDNVSQTRNNEMQSFIE